jgi:hypothetical protein
MIPTELQCAVIPAATSFQRSIAPYFLMFNISMYGYEELRLRYPQPLCPAKINKSLIALAVPGYRTAK